MALFDENSDARTERPTDRRRRQAREQGQVAHSAELLIAARLLAIWIVLACWFVSFAATYGASLRATLESAGSNTLQPPTALALVRDLAWQLLASASWPLITVTIAVLVSHFAQIGWLWRWDNLAPQPSRLLSMTGLQRLLSLSTIGRSLKLTLKLSLASATIALAVSSQARLMPTSLSSSLNEQLVNFGTASVSLVARVAMAVLTFAALDYVWQRWRFERSLQMTREEVREELKESEGPPQQKTHRQIITQPRTTPSIAHKPVTNPPA